MSANTMDRGLIRKALASLLTSYLVGTGKPAQVVFDHQTGDFNGQAPAVVVTTAADEPSLSDQLSDDSLNQSLLISVMVFVPYVQTDASGAVVFSESDSEDALDDIHRLTLNCVIDNPSLSGTVHEIKPEGRSLITPAVIGGEPYRVEVIQFRAVKANA